MVKNGYKYLITTDNWFVAPDGIQYKAVWGTCQVRTIKDIFQIEPKRPSTNWFLEIGSDGKEMIVAGCQIHYAVRCDEEPNDFYAGVATVSEDGLIAPNWKIYIAE